MCKRHPTSPLLADHLRIIHKLRQCGHAEAGQKYFDAESVEHGSNSLQHRVPALAAGQVVGDLLKYNCEQLAARLCEGTRHEVMH